MQLGAKAVLNNAVIQDVTPASTGTTYISSNQNIVGVTADGLVNANGPGNAFVLASNDSVSATIAIRVGFYPAPTTLEGIVLLESGSPVAGAEVSADEFGVSTLTDSQGLFSIPVTLQGPGQISVSVQASIGGRIIEGAIAGIVPAPWMITDVGIVYLNNSETCQQLFAPGWQRPGVNGPVTSFAIFNDGRGLSAFVGGVFTRAGDLMTPSIAGWDGTSWTNVGGGTSGFINALIVHDDGSGAALYAGGSFLEAGGIVVNNIAKWDGKAWSALGTGLGVSFGTINALATYDDGTGPALYAAGNFDGADGMPAVNIAKWDGITWSALAQVGVDDEVKALAVYQNKLILGGRFGHVLNGGISVDSLVAYDGTTWSALTAFSPNPITYVAALAVVNLGAGPLLYVGGSFDWGAGRTGIAKWNGAALTSLGTGVSGEVTSIVGHNDGAGFSVWVAGHFSQAGGLRRWNGTSWFDAVGGGVSPYFEPRLGSMNIGNGMRLYYGNWLETTDFGFVGAWDGTTWSPLGTGPYGYISAIENADLGQDELLIMGGHFVSGGSPPVRNVGLWNGSTLSPLLKLSTFVDGCCLSNRKGPFPPDLCGVEIHEDRG